MYFNRRNFVAGVGAALIAPRSGMAQATADNPDTDYAEYDLDDYFDHIKGPVKDVDAGDLQMVETIISRMKGLGHVEIMETLEALTDKGSTGELFNTRWKKFGNPLIVKFFHDIGYKRTPMPGDCTAWCAATLSWCLQTAGKSIPNSNPASSQAFLHVGTKVSTPKRGDICVFTDLDDPAHGHVALFSGFEGDSKVKILGANQSGSSPTACGPGYRRSKVSYTVFPINPARDSAVFSKYLAAYVRPE